MVPYFFEKEDVGDGSVLTTVLQFFTEILKDGSFELITRIKLDGAIAKTSEEINTEKLAKKGKMKVAEDIEKMMTNVETADFEVWCEGEVVKCHKAILGAR